MWGGEYFVVVIGVATALLAVVGHFVLVVPARHDPRCCVPARFTYWSGLAGFVIGCFYTLLVGPEPWVVGPAFGLLFGGLMGYGVGRFAGLWLLTGGNENES